MKFFKKTVTVALSVLFVLLTFSGCTKEGTESWVEYDDVSYITVANEKKEKEDSSGTADTSSSKGKKAPTGTVKLPDEIKGRFEKLDYSGKTIKLLVWYNPQNWEQKIYDDFEKITGAKIKLVQQGSFASGVNKLAALIAANDAPDATMMTQDKFPHYITKKLVQPLTKFIDKSKDTWLAYDIMDDIKYDGQYYGITDHFWGDIYFVYFNKDLFNKNLDVQKNPLELYKEGKWNWDAFYDLAKKMTVKDDQGHITQYGSITTERNLFALSAGANVCTPNNGHFTNTLNTKQMKDAAAMEKKLAEGKYYVNNAGDFANGNVAMYVCPQYYIRSKGRLDRSKGKISFDWDFAPFPAYTGGKSYNPAGYQFGVVPNKAKNAEAGYMLLNYRSYCQENLTTLTQYSEEWTERFKKTALGSTHASLDVGIIGDSIWNFYSELFNAGSNAQTTIDSWIPKVDGKIKTYEDEQKAYK